MLITKDYHFPTPVSGKSTVDIIHEDERERKLEQQILAELRTNDDKTLLSNADICINDPSGVPRCPPEHFINQLRQHNEQFDLRSVLCSIENPDLLETLNQDQGPQRVMPAIIQMLFKNTNAVDRIPLQCLCQLMILVEQQNGSSQNILPSLPLEIRELVVGRLQKILTNTQENVKTVEIAVTYFLTTLCSSNHNEREAAQSALCTLLMPPADIMIIDTAVECLVNITHFEQLKDVICEDLSKCCMIENHMSRLVSYIEFITNHAFHQSISTPKINRISELLTNVVKRVTDNSSEHKQVRDALVRFYASYIQVVSNAEKSKQGTPLDTDLHISCSDPLMEFDISTQILEAIMELLCDVFGNDIDSACASREYLMKIWFPSTSRQLRVTKSNSRNVVVDVLPKSLRIKMLSSYDERVIKVALDGMSPEQALDFLQTFALSPLSCSYLLAILNNSTLPKSEKARAAIPFVRAYKLKGAHGVDEFLSNLPESEAQHNSTTQEQFISSFPSLDKVETEMPKEIAVGNFESMENVTKYFDELLTISDPEDVSCQILSHLRQKAEKIYPKGNFITSMLAEFRANLQPKSERSELERMNKLNKDLQTMSADEIVKLLSDPNPTVHGQRLLIYRINIASSTRTIRKVLTELLDDFDLRLIASSVVVFVHGATRRRHVWPSAKQCSVLMDYVLSAISLILPESKPVNSVEPLEKFLEIIQATIESESSSDLLLEITKSINLAKRRLQTQLDDGGKRRIRALNLLEEGITIKYPDMTTGNSSQKKRYLDVSQIDEMFHKSITELFALISSPVQDKMTEEMIAKDIDKILSESKRNCRVVSRQIPLFSVYVSQVVQIPFKQLRDSMLPKMLELAVDVIVQTSPNAFDQSESVHSILQALLTFLENNTSKMWHDLLEKTLQASRLYLENNPTAASTLISGNVQILKGFSNRGLHEKTDLMALIENIPYSSLYGDDSV
ncbi:integrator complex subunit 1 [Ditylenchus destructor]|uniref:Integrator complex subunit 1 n=1 Tax=Ditylenchus destructor TaxID=166010 RepID=A0AAD4N9S9_9BILA|nr:integrator complex subunit 1 [Ditylenchus destructor]